MKYVEELGWPTIWEWTIMLLICSWAKKFGLIGLIVNKNNNKKAHAILVKCELPMYQ
jgi:hypothetical protein